MSFKFGFRHILVAALYLYAANVVFATTFSNGILWKISTSGGESGYILGTMHSDLPRVTAIPDKVQHALNQSRSFTAELDLKLSSIREAQARMMLRANENLSEIIGLSRFRQCSQIMADYGVPESVVARMKPWAVAVQINLPKPTTGIFLDLKLFQLAQARGMQTYGLETVIEQISVFDNLSLIQQIALLDEAIGNYKDLPKIIQELIGYYLSRDLEGMQKYSSEIMAKGNKQLSALLQQRLILDRNRRMVERMKPRLDEGRAFIAVGALHLPGDKGILQLLKNAGYRIESVY